MSYIIGLTGGIGSGKTLVSDRFAELGVAIIDTDVIARLIVQPEHPALQQLVVAFGASILQANGELNRGALRQVAFSSDVNKAKLDAITHPAIRSETLKQINQVNTPYCLVVVPLLTKNSPFIEFMQRVLVVTTNKETKINRVKIRSNLTRDEVERIMQTQLDDEERLLFADDVIQNDGTVDDAYSEVAKLHALYTKLASSSN